MSPADLRQEVYTLVLKGEETGDAPRPRTVIEHIRGIGVRNDELAIRDTLWQMLENDELELTADRRLRPGRTRRAEGRR